MDLKPNIYYETILQYREAELLLEAIKLDVFSYLDNPISHEEFVKLTKYDSKNSKYFLQTLVSCGYIEKQGLKYCNTETGKLYLSKNSSKYIGKVFLFREKLGSLSGIGDKIKDDSVMWQAKIDFLELAEVVNDEMYITGRIDDFNKENEQLFPQKDKNYKILDLGGGSGVLAIEFVKKFSNSNSYIFETPKVAAISKKTIEKNEMQDKVFVMQGDFNLDDIGSGYDLIIASGIFNFVNIDIAEFMCKLSKALVSGGYLMIVGSFFENEEEHKEHMLNWLKGYINGMKPGPVKSEVEKAIKKAQLLFKREIKIGLFDGAVYEKG